MVPGARPSLNRPQTFKTYPAAPVQLLPRALVASELSAVEVLSGSRAERHPGSCFARHPAVPCDGVVRVMRTPEGEDVWFRSAMCGQPPPGGDVRDKRCLGSVYHYDPLGHELALVRPAPADGRRRRRHNVVLSGVPLTTAGGTVPEAGPLCGTLGRSSQILAVSDATSTQGHRRRLVPRIVAV